MLLSLSFRSGGFPADATALAGIVLVVLLAARLLLAEDPFAGLSLGLGVAAGALGLYAAWTLVSVAWSHAPARALVEFDRTLLYLLALVYFGSFPRTTPRMLWLVRGLALGIVLVCLAALASRTVPELWPADPSTAGLRRLSYPITYWNALGAMAGLGTLLCFFLTTSAGESLAVRVLAAAALPALASTLVLTFSRGAIAACIAGVALFVIFARPHGLPGGFLAIGPTVTVAAIATYRADGLADAALSPAATAQGHDLALLVVGCAALAALVRALGAATLDRARSFLPGGLTSVVLGAVATVTTVTAAAIWLANGGAGVIERQYDRFLVPEGGVGGAETRTRLTEAGGNGRRALWEAALEGFREDRLTGKGAGTYPILWNRHRPFKTEATDAHSVYVESLGELGLVGITLLVTTLAALLLATAARMRGPDRAVYAALFAAMTAWAVHAAIDWLWEMPAITLWVFCAGGAALASKGRVRPGDRRRLWRACTVLVTLLLAVTPTLVGLSQLRLDDGIEAFERDDCAAAVDAGLSSISVLGARPEPYEILGYCNSRRGLHGPAIRAFERAIARDRENWELHYGLAVAQAAAGMDPRAAAREAARLNPRNEDAQETAQAFQNDRPRAWRRASRAVPLPFP